MKKVVKTSILTATVAVAIMFFGGCDKTTGGGDLTPGGFNGKITATVEDGNSDIKLVVPWNAPEIKNNQLLGKQMGDPVNFSNNRFTINLPDPPPSGIQMHDIKYVFENILNVSGSLKYSDSNVLVTDVDFLAHDGDKYFIGIFNNTTSDGKTTCIYVYAEGKVTVTGGNNISVSLEEGWNRLYFTDDGKNNKFTTKAPDGLKWYYKGF
jgi:hypothetical protein